MDQKGEIIHRINKLSPLKPTLALPHFNSIVTYEFTQSLQRSLFAFPRLCLQLQKKDHTLIS